MRTSSWPGVPALPLLSRTLDASECRTLYVESVGATRRVVNASPRPVIAPSQPTAPAPRQRDHRLSEALFLTIRGLTRAGMITLILQTARKEDHKTLSPVA